MKLASYIVKYDTGIAPNPFWGYCTVALCTPNKKNYNLQKDDWIVGLLAKDRDNRLLYAMKISEILGFDEYYHDKRFKKKIPNPNGNRKEQYGDNMYHKNNAGRWQQVKCQGHPHYGQAHLIKDTKIAKVFIASKFYYFGKNSKVIPDQYNIFKNALPTRGLKYYEPPYVDVGVFISWLDSNHETGVHGDPND